MAARDTRGKAMALINVAQSNPDDIGVVARDMCVLGGFDVQDDFGACLNTLGAPGFDGLRVVQSHWAGSGAGSDIPVSRDSCMSRVSITMAHSK